MVKQQLKQFLQFVINEKENRNSSSIILINQVRSEIHVAH